MKNLTEISNIIASLKTQTEICGFLNELLTESEITALSKRWRILKLLSQGETQRKIAKDMNVSLCKITRGAKLLKEKDAIVTQYFTKGKNDDKN